MTGYSLCWVCWNSRVSKRQPMSASRLNFLAHLNSNWRSGELTRRGTTMVLFDSSFLIIIASFRWRSWWVFSDSHCTNRVRSLMGFLHKISGLLLLGKLITPPRVQKHSASRTRASAMLKKVWRILCLDGVRAWEWQLSGNCSSCTRWH